MLFFTQDAICKKFMMFYIAEKKYPTLNNAIIAPCAL